MHLPKISTRAELRELVEEIGFIPLFDGSLPGFSVQSLKKGGWWSDDPAEDPWLWRQMIAAEGDLLYGKFLERKAAFFSQEWYGIFANFRRDGYDYDARYNDGLSSYREKKIMDLFFETENCLPSYEIRRLAGFGLEGEKGFDGILTGLQMRGYLITRGMECKRNRRGEPYGCPVSIFSTPEALLGENFFSPYYKEEPADSLHRLCAQLQKITGADEKQALRFLRG